MDDFARQPATALRLLRELRDTDFRQFLDQAFDALRKFSESPATAHLVRMMMSDEALERLTDPRFLPIADAIVLATHMQKFDPSIDIRLLRLLLPIEKAAVADRWQATRVLEVVGAISDGRRIQPVLQILLRHPDPLVRSKASLLVGRLNRNLQWLEAQLADPDPRIRANAVESVWGVDSSKACTLFLSAATDPHHRVAANAVVALHRAGEIVSAQIAETMAVHQDANFRGAAAWAMGQTQDPRFLPTLIQMMAEQGGPVCRNALRAMVNIRKRLATLCSLDALRLTVHRSHSCLEVGVLSAKFELMSGLPATSFVVMSDGKSAEIGSVVGNAEGGRLPVGTCLQDELGDYSIALAAPPTSAFRVGVYAPSGMGEIDDLNLG